MFLTSNAQEAKIVIIINANPTIIVEINMPPKLLALAFDSKQPTCSS